MPINTTRSYCRYVAKCFKLGGCYSAFLNAIHKICIFGKDFDLLIITKLKCMYFLKTYICLNRYPGSKQDSDNFTLKYDGI